MWRLAVLMWVVLGTVLAGLLVLVIVATPSLSVQAMKLIPYAVAVGAALGIPVSIVVAKAIAAKTIA